jgi:hypothetical protein
MENKTLEDFFYKSFDNISTNVNAITENLNKTTELIIKNSNKFLFDNVSNPLDKYIQLSKPKKTLYYRVKISGKTKYEHTNYFEDIMEPLENLNYAGFAIVPMCDSTFQIQNNDIIAFIGYLNSGNNSVPSIYNETFTIILDDNINSTIQAVSSYNNNGDGLITTVDSTVFTVISSNGIFSGCKIIKIEFNNIDYTRICYIY